VYDGDLVKVIIAVPESVTTTKLCPKCNHHLRLILLQPMEVDEEKRMYRCDSCGHIETKTVKYYRSTGTADFRAQ
jgi:transposase